MSTATPNYAVEFAEYRRSSALRPVFLQGDALRVLSELPSESVDCCMTSPPYWGHRSYTGGGIGQEEDYAGYIANLAAVLGEAQRVLKSTGSLWLNIGDSYLNKALLGVPWRVALHLIDKQGWILRNSVVWNKVKGGPDNSKDKLRNVHEFVFHFAKTARGYYYDVDSIRRKPGSTRVVNGALVSATGVSGVRYRRQIELSTMLSEAEKKAANSALDALLADLQEGKITDFRMIIRGHQRTTHSDSEAVSGRARELQEKGFLAELHRPLYSPVRRLTLRGVVSKPRSALDQVRHPGSVVPIRTCFKRVSRREEEKEAELRCRLDLSDQTSTGSSTVSDVVADERLKDRRKSTDLLACEAARKMNVESSAKNGSMKHLVSHSSNRGHVSVSPTQLQGRGRRA